MSEINTLQIFNEAIKGEFDMRKTQNEQIVLFLQRSSQFQKELQRLRKKLKIPKLNPLEDIKIGFKMSGYGEDTREEAIIEHKWLDSQGNKFSLNFENEVKKIIEKYNLPAIYFDWIFIFLLYEEFSNTPSLWFGALEQFLATDPEFLFSQPLNTKEKKLVKETIRNILKIKNGRPSKRIKKVYAYFTKLLNKKNRNRTLRSLDSSQRVFKKGDLGKFEDYDHKPENLTYLDLAGRIFLDASFSEDYANAIKLRKQNQRIKQREKTFIKKVKK